jgi:FKBP-type peptidyl-prolyl cis-trans isomerase
VKINLCVIAPASIVAATVLALTGCGSQTASSGGSSPSAATSQAASTAPSGAFVTGDGGVTVTGAAGAKPTTTIGAETKNTNQLTVKDLIVGTGAEAKPTDTITAHYVGIGGISGQQFDSSWDRGQAAQFPLNGVIVGWQNGIPGMKVGGRRLLVIPGDQAYGANPPAGSGIQPNEPLVFVVDLVSIP